MLMPCIAPLYTAGGSSGAAWEIDNLTYSQSYTASELASKINNAIAFKDDGTIMYLGAFEGYVYQYTLSSAWDVSTASYASKSADVTAEGTNLRGVAIKSDGAKMYITNASAIFQYTLGTPYDLSTASYDSKSFNFTTQTTVPTETRFSSDGTKMYTCASDDKIIYQYTLSVAWDVSSASFASKEKNVGSEVGSLSPNGLFLGKSGTRMYVSSRDVSSTNDILYQYDLGTAWDVSTASYASKSKNVSANTELIQGIYASSDGAKFYCYGSDDAVDEYTI